MLDQIKSLTDSVANENALLKDLNMSASDRQKFASEADQEATIIIEPKAKLSVLKKNATNQETFRQRKKLKFLQSGKVTVYDKAVRPDPYTLERMLVAAKAGEGRRKTTQNASLVDK